MPVRHDPRNGQFVGSGSSGKFGSHSTHAPVTHGTATGQRPKTSSQQEAHVRKVYAINQKIASTPVKAVKEKLTAQRNAVMDKYHGRGKW